MSIDGVVQDPSGEESLSRGGWFARSGGNDLEEWAKVSSAEPLGAAALLQGRRS
jgi:hypothetical protein